MPPLLVHASLEHGESAWGGISSILDLLVAASASIGQRVAVMSIGSRDRTVPLGQEATLYVIGMPELAGTVLYRHPDRIRLAGLAGERMAAALGQIRNDSEISLCVHNDELVRLVNICSAFPWRRTCVAFLHGLARQEHPGRADLHAQQDELVECVELRGGLLANTPGPSNATILH